MIKLEKISVYNLENAIIGMRNPMDSWDKSDSKLVPVDPKYRPGVFKFVIGPNNLNLMHSLLHGGPPHDKFMRQILCSMQITAPIYWWKEMDTYKIATTANSTSTMHKIHSRPFNMSNFSFDLPISMDTASKEHYARLKQVKKDLIDNLEWLRQQYLATKDQITDNNPYWRSLIQLLPESYNQTRMWTADYETLRRIYKWRKDHKLSEWRDFCNIMITDRAFLYGKELIAYELD